MQHLYLLKYCAAVQMQYFHLIQVYISQANVVHFTPLHLSDSLSYKFHVRLLFFFFLINKLFLKHLGLAENMQPKTLFFWDHK